MNWLMHPCLTATLSLTLASDPLSTSEVLEHIRTATGHAHLRDAENGFVEEGTASLFGQSVPLRFWFDAAGRFIETIAGELGQTRVFDGTHLYEVDATGVPNRLALGERETQLYSAWLWSGFWLAPDAPFTITIDGARTTDDTVALKLRLKQGRLTAGVLVDRATWLPRSSDSGRVVRPGAITFEDYHEHLGMRRPRRHTETGIATTLTEVTALRLATAEERAACQPPREVEDTDFATDVESALQVKRAASGHLLVPAKINGQDAGWFIFDTGAGQTCIDFATSKRLQLVEQGGAQAIGVGGAARASLCRADTFTIGPMTIENARLIGLDLNSLDAPMGEEIAGVCGFDVFRRSVVVVDMQDAKLELYPPGDFVLENAEWQELMIYGRHPCIACRFDAGKPEPSLGIFKLDTGAAPDTVTFHAPAVREFDLLQGRTTADAMVGGVGGMSPARSGVIEFFELAAHRFTRPRVNFSLASSGAFVDEYTAGNIGGKFMAPFRIVFDYGNHRIAFVHKAHGD